MDLSNFKGCTPDETKTIETETSQEICEKIVEGSGNVKHASGLFLMLYEETHNVFSHEFQLWQRLEKVIGDLGQIHREIQGLTLPIDRI